MSKYHILITELSIFNFCIFSTDFTNQTQNWHCSLNIAILSQTFESIIEFSSLQVKEGLNLIRCSNQSKSTQFLTNKIIYLKNINLCNIFLATLTEMSCSHQIHAAAVISCKNLNSTRQVTGRFLRTLQMSTWRQQFFRVWGYIIIF